MQFFDPWILIFCHDKRGLENSAIENQIDGKLSNWQHQKLQLILQFCSQLLQAINWLPCRGLFRQSHFYYLYLHQSIDCLNCSDKTASYLRMKLLFGQITKAKISLFCSLIEKYLQPGNFGRLWGKSVVWRVWTTLKTRIWANILKRKILSI